MQCAGEFFFFFFNQKLGIRTTLEHFLHVSFYLFPLLSVDWLTFFFSLDQTLRVFSYH
ncbi:hypothetical protein HanIR_Chr02g0070731 [Helianthus annuus]|nr:hypothetical protein HanIR_Chr02g0070731 [Helianthus annuus]